MKRSIQSLSLATCLVALSGCGDSHKTPDVKVTVVNKISANFVGKKPAVTNIAICARTPGAHKSVCETLEKKYVDHNEEKTYGLSLNQVHRLHKEGNGKVEFHLGDSEQTFASAQWPCRESAPDLKPGKNQNYRLEVTHSTPGALWYRCKITE